MMWLQIPTGQCNVMVRLVLVSIEITFLVLSFIMHEQDYLLTDFFYIMFQEIFDVSNSIKRILAYTACLLGLSMKIKSSHA